MIINFLKAKKQNTILYSCVVDDHPKFYWQGYIFVNTLLHLAKVSGERIFIHLTKSNIQFENFLKLNNVNIRYIKPWGDNKYCNKLQQIETHELQKADYVFLCDSDLAICEDIALQLPTKKVILGKTVDFDNPPIETLLKVFDMFNISIPIINHETLNKKPTFDGNFNGGLYGIPGKKLKPFGREWKKWAEKLLASHNALTLLGDKSHHIDQISFCMALKTTGLSYKKIDEHYNCPTHVNFNLLAKIVDSPPKVLHFHKNLTSAGLLETTKLDSIDHTIAKVNQIIQNNFENPLFRALKNIDHSEKEIVKALKALSIDSYNSFLQVGSIKSELLTTFSFINYHYVDSAEDVLSRTNIECKHYTFHSIEKDINMIPAASCVLCLDLVSQQNLFNSRKDLIDFLAKKTLDTLIISIPDDSSKLLGKDFDFKDTIEYLYSKQFDAIFKIELLNNILVIVANKNNGINNNPNDIKKQDLNNALTYFSEHQRYINETFLYQCIHLSRVHFGWYTKHIPRIYEYPWLLEQLQKLSLKEFTIGDFGAGITPLPIALSYRCKQVITIDNHIKIHSLENIKKANEWGYFDYSILDLSIKSFNQALQLNTFAEKSFDVWYSISVVEHMPAKIRIEIFSIFSKLLKTGGKLFLTVDLIKDDNKLWNYSEGKLVENTKVHGDIDSLENELESLGFVSIETDIVRTPKDERVDIALICATYQIKERQ